MVLHDIKWKDYILIVSQTDAASPSAKRSDQVAQFITDTSFLSSPKGRTVFLTGGSPEGFGFVTAQSY